MSNINLNSAALYQIMNHNNIWSGVNYDTVINDMHIVAHIPQEALTRGHMIPKRIMNWILTPSAENRMKLLIHGVHVRYEYAESSAFKFEAKEVA